MRFFVFFFWVCFVKFIVFYKWFFFCVFFENFEMKKNYESFILKIVYFGWEIIDKMLWCYEYIF